MNARLIRARGWLTGGWRRMLARLAFILTALNALGWVVAAAANGATPKATATIHPVAAASQAHQLPCYIVPVTCIPGVPSPSSVLKVFNPFQWLYDAIQGLTNDLVTLYEKAILNPPTPVKGGPLDYLYGNALGLADTLAIPIAIVFLTFAMFQFKLIDRAAQAFVMVVALALFGPYWFAACDYVVAMRIQLGQDLMHMSDHATGSSTILSVPSISNILGGIIGLGGVMAWGYILVEMILVETVLIVVVKFLGLIAWVFMPLGDRSKKFLSALISTGIVSMLLGALTAILCLECAKILSVKLSLGSGLIASFWETGWMMTACVAQPVLFVMAYKWSKQRVTGSVNALSRVSGKVQTETRQRLQADINTRANMMYAQTAKPAAGIEGAEGQSLTRRAKKALGSEIKYQGATYIGTRLAARAAVGTAGVATGGVALVGATVAQHIASKHREHSITKGKVDIQALKRRPPGRPTNKGGAK